MLHKCFILGGILQTYSTHTSVACDFMMGVAVVPTGMLTCRKRGLGGRKPVLFCAFCTENETESKLFLHAYCYANGSDSSVSVSISLFVMTTSLGTNYVWNMAQR